MGKLGRTIFLVVVMAATAFFAPQAVSADGAYFQKPEATVHFWSNPKPAAFTVGGENVIFVMEEPSRELKLLSADGQKEYLSFNSYFGDNMGIAYSVRKIVSPHPNMEFVEIAASQGTRAYNSGYWIVGKRDGQWVTYVSIDSLKTMGYSTDKPHKLRTIINNDGTGRFILETSYRYMPPGATYGSEARTVVDLRLELTWDEGARWFAMRSI